MVLFRVAIFETSRKYAMRSVCVLLLRLQFNMMSCYVALNLFKSEIISFYGFDLLCLNEQFVTLANLTLCLCTRKYDQKHELLPLCMNFSFSPLRQKTSNQGCVWLEF